MIISVVLLYIWPLMLHCVHVNFAIFFLECHFLYFLPVGESIMIFLLSFRLALMRLRGVACLRLVSTVWPEFYATYRNWEWLLIQVIIIRIIIHVHVCTCTIHSLLLEQYFFRGTTKLTCTCILLIHLFIMICSCLMDVHIHVFQCQKYTKYICA